MINSRWPYKTGGIPDELFMRGQVPMTKAEVRVVTIAKAMLDHNHVIWDIGAGTGSISIEAAHIADSGHVFAIEKETDAVELIGKNLHLFGLNNVTVCPGEAPEALAGLPRPNRVFIGGSGGNFKEIARLVHEKMPVGGRLVINAVVLETLTSAVEIMKSLDFFDIDISQISVAKFVDLGKLHMFKSHNPVFVISGQKR